VVSEQQRLAGVLVDFARTLARGYELDDILHELGEHVLHVVPAAGAGISLVDAAGELHFVAATDAVIERVEAVQDDLRQGPSRDAYDTGQPVVAADLRHTDRWPAFGRSAIAAGMLAAAGFPLLAGGTCIGALNVYRHEARAFTDGEVAAAQVLADMATGYVINVRDLHRAQQLTRQLQHALHSRILIEQAKGYLAAQVRTDVDDAFERLRRHARSTNRTLRDTASDLLDGRLAPGELS
jgi:GAF domain-containing protein